MSRIVQGRSSLEGETIHRIPQVVVVVAKEIVDIGLCKDRAKVFGDEEVPNDAMVGVADIRSDLHNSALERAITNASPASYAGNGRGWAEPSLSGGGE